MGRKWCSRSRGTKVSSREECSTGPNATESIGAEESGEPGS